MVSLRLPFNTRVTPLLNILYIPMGIFVKRYSSVYENSLIVVLNFLFVVIAFNLIRNYSELDSRLYRMDNTVYVIADLFVAASFWIARCHRVSMLEIFHAVAKFEADEHFAKLTRRFLNPLLLKVTSWHTAAFFLIMALPIFAACLTNAELGSTPTLIFPSWIPWEVRTVGRYILTIVLQLISGSLLYLIAFSQEIIVVCYIAVVRAHIANFQSKVKQMEDDAFTLVDRKTMPSNRLYKYQVRQFQGILVLFLDIHRFVKDIIACSNPFSSNSLFIFFDGSVLLTAMFLESRKTPGLYSLKMLSGEVLGCAMFGVFCYLGNVVKYMNEEFRAAVYNMKWYEKSPAFRKQILIFMQLTHMPVQMKAFKMYTIEIAFLGKIIRVCFSLLQLLIRLQNKSALGKNYSKNVYQSTNSYHVHSNRTF